MLVEFSVENFRSFKERATFSMLAVTKLKSFNDNSELDENNVFKVTDKISLLKSAGIYGANASGKSNFVKAMAFARVFIIDSTNIAPTKNSSFEPFRLSNETIEKPSHFEFVFILKGILYRYGFKLTPAKVVEEYLYYTPKNREAILFTRNENSIDSKPAFKGGKGLKIKTREDSLFLTVAYQFNVNIAKEIINWFFSLNTLENEVMPIITMVWLGDENKKKLILEFISNFDIHIKDINIEDKLISPEEIPAEMPQLLRDFLLTNPAKSINSIHNKYNSDGEIIDFETFKFSSNESEGTKRLLALSAPILNSLQKGAPLLIDEIEASLHPNLSKLLLQIYNSKELNKNNSQLIFTTHNEGLMSKSLMRRDQIWFVEKNLREESSLYSLAEFKIRNDLAYNSNYLLGRFGAVPFLNKDELIRFMDNADDKIK